MRRLRATVHGRVQGVGFRAYTAAEGRRLGLSGWVRNELDGTVSVVAEGSGPALEALLAWLHRGPPLARVTSVDAEWLAATGDLASFQTR